VPRHISRTGFSACRRPGSYPAGKYSADRITLPNVLVAVSRSGGLSELTAASYGATALVLLIGVLCGRRMDRAAARPGQLAGGVAGGFGRPGDPPRERLRHRRERPARQSRSWTDGFGGLEGVALPATADPVQLRIAARALLATGAPGGGGRAGSPDFTDELREVPAWR
jgi:hypothetical protein